MNRFFALSNRYPRAHEKRPPFHSPSTRTARKGFLKAAAINFFLLQLLFLCLFAYLFGALYVQDTHIHNLDVVFVDYDGGLLGDTIRDAYKSLQGDGFPTLIEQTPSEFATSDNLRNEVCKSHYWAAIYTSSGASNRLQDALSSPSTQYSKSDLLTYIWNEAQFPTVVDGAISGALQTLSSTARVAFASHNWTSTVIQDSAAFTIFADPWHLTSINIQPTTQGSRLIYNSLVILLLVMQEFFYLGTINGLGEACKIYTRLKPHRIILVRSLILALYTLIGSLCVTGMIWAFRASWKVNANQFVLTWMIFWLFTHVNLLILDSFTVWIPHPFVPMVLITWAVLNVTSVLVPFALSPGFYHWGYSLPAHDAYEVLVDIWSGGCNAKLHYALPILFSWEVCGLILSALGIHRRAHYAIIKAEAEANAFQIRLDNALAFEHQRDEERRKVEAADAILPVEEEERKELERTISQSEVQEQKALSQSTRSTSFGPTFGFAFGIEEPDKKD